MSSPLPAFLHRILVLKQLVNLPELMQVLSEVFFFLCGITVNLLFTCYLSYNNYVLNEHFVLLGLGVKLFVVLIRNIR